MTQTAPPDTCKACGHTGDEHVRNDVIVARCIPYQGGIGSCACPGYAAEPPEPPRPQSLGALTEPERQLVDLLGRCANLYAQHVVGHGPSRDGYLAEFTLHIHGCQHAVLAQAAARAYPDRYRLAGGDPVVVTRADDSTGGS